MKRTAIRPPMPSNSTRPAATAAHRRRRRKWPWTPESAASWYLRASPISGQRAEHVLDRHQPGDIGADRLAKLRGQAPERLIALGLAGRQHGTVPRDDATAARQTRLDDTSKPGLVQCHFLKAWTFAREGVRPVLFPEATQADVALGRDADVQAPACSFSTTASATWLVPTEVGSLRLSFMS